VPRMVVAHRKRGRLRWRVILTTEVPSFAALTVEVMNRHGRSRSVARRLLCYFVIDKPWPGVVETSSAFAFLAQSPSTARTEWCSVATRD
jgi:hypothetical protein